jgi:hypothetical protein
MPQTFEYMSIEASDNKQLDSRLNTFALKNWKPILFTTSTSGLVTMFHVILEREAGA